MKHKSALLTLLCVVTIFPLSGCGTESSQEESNEVTIVSEVDIRYVKGYVITLGDLANYADLIVLGTVTGTVEVLPHKTLDQVWRTTSAFQVEKSFKGEYSNEIVIIQTGAVGKGENPGNPVFEAGEQCFLFFK